MMTIITVAVLSVSPSVKPLILPMIQNPLSFIHMTGLEPQPIVGLGGTDTRLWRYRDIPAYVYGPSPKGMGKTDERVGIEEFLHIVRTHALSAYDYLQG